MVCGGSEGKPSDGVDMGRFRTGGRTSGGDGGSGDGERESWTGGGSTPLRAKRKRKRHL